MTDEDVLERASALLGHAIRRQVWVMFLDQHDRQLPLLMPSYVPRAPRAEHRENYSRVLGVLFEESGADSLVVAYERRGPDELTPADQAWLALIRDACCEIDARLRGPLLVHDEGVRWIAPGDIGAPEP